MEIKFEAWDKKNKAMIPWSIDMFSDMSPVTFYGDEFPDDKFFILRQYIGLHDIDGKEWYYKDIGEFANGDRFVIECEDWLQYFIEWIGKIYKSEKGVEGIEKAKKIGNCFENPELLAKTQTVKKT